MLKRTGRKYFNKEFFLVLMPLFFVLHGFIPYYEGIYWTDAVQLFLLYSVFSVSIVFLLNFVFLAFRNAAIYTFMLLLFNFLFGSLHDLARQYFGKSVLTQYSFLLPLILLLFTILFFALLKTKRSFSKLASYLNLLFLLLIFVDLIRLAAKKLTQQEALIKKLTPCKNCPKPDIYLLVVDGYGGHKQLQEKFSFNNNAFEDSLKSKGFYVVDSSISNYGATHSSISSLLNMRYLSAVTSDDFHRDLNKNNFTEYLKSNNYQIKNYSFFKIAGQFPPQEIEYFPFGKELITKHTFTARLNNDIGHKFLFSNKSGNEHSRFNNKQQTLARQTSGRDYFTMQQLLSEVKSQKQVAPKFVYCHFLMPHPPYLFDKNGNRADLTSTKEAQYIDYLEYTNERMLFAIDKILAASATPPAILLMSDHGYRDDDNPDLTSDRFLTHNSIYLPEKNYSKYYKGISNVNMFRMFLNEQFNQQLPLLADSTVF